MSRISEAFQNRKAFIPFITGGDPNLDVTKKLPSAMQEAGADLIEIGIPFSDPIAEGVVIQAANERALAAGFSAAERLRRQDGRSVTPPSARGAKTTTACLGKTLPPPYSPKGVCGGERKGGNCLL